MIPFPVLSIITWAPFVGALLIMFLARHSPLAVRLIALVTTSISTVLSVFIYIVYDREAAGFQFFEKVPLVPPLGIAYEIAVDGILNVLSAWTLRAGDRARRLQSGLPQDYVYGVAFGVLLLFVLAHWRIR